MIRLSTLLLIAAACLAAPAEAQRGRRPAYRGKKKLVRATVGKPAPDFTLQRLGVKKNGKPVAVTLSTLAADKPVLLIFGSYT